MHIAPFVKYALKFIVNNAAASAIFTIVMEAITRALKKFK